MPVAVMERTLAEICEQASLQSPAEFVEKPEILIGKNVKFERIRRITGYLVGTVDNFNNAKQAEVRDRVKHSMATGDREQI